jgi:hypothetical protein
MRLTTREIVFPEGDRQEIAHALSVNQLVDLNGFPLPLPLATTRQIAYRVLRKSTSCERNGDLVSYYLELVGRPELEEERSWSP